jgi:hypothetical protein
MTKDFAASLERRLTGGAEPEPEPAPEPAAATPTQAAQPPVTAPASAPEPAAPRGLPSAPIAAGVGALLFILFALLVRSRRAR